MVEQQIKASVLCDLRLGVIQPYQIETTLRNKGVSSFESGKLADEIKERYRKEHLCY